MPFPANGAIDPFRFFAVHATTSFELGLAYDHFIAGGDSIVLLLEAIVARYVAAGETPPQPLPSLYPSTFRRLLIRHAGAVLRGAFSLPRLALNCRRSHRPRYLRWPDPSNGFAAFGLTPPEFSAVLRTPQEWGVTLNDLLIAVMLRTLSPLADKRLAARRSSTFAASSGPKFGRSSASS